MRYRHISEIGGRYQGEVGTPGHRAHLETWDDIVAKLKKAIVDLKNLLQAPKSGAPVAAPTGRSVADLAKFHMAQVTSGANEAQIQAARKKIVEYRQWLSRQGVTADKDGNVQAANVTPAFVVYDQNLAQQGATRIHFSGGRLFTDAACNTPLDTDKMVTHFSGPGKAIYVMSAAGNLHVSSHIVGHRHHSSLLAGGNVACGGELEVANGYLRWLSNKSGHYRPQLPHLFQVLHELQKKNVSMTFALSVVPGNTEYATVGLFLKQMELDDVADYELSKLLAYSRYLDDSILVTKGWRWRHPPDEKAGVYNISTGVMVPHKEVRTWLKSTNRFADDNLQRGNGR
jgi:hypothetical protein